jgi:uncharacterized protein
MTAVSRVLDNYARLRAYCDSFFFAVADIYHGDMVCRKGCFACCELNSVCALEAHAMAVYVAGRPRVRTGIRKKNAVCAFCMDGACCAYPARPVICRTHGAVISVDKGNTVARSCDLNFRRTDPAALPETHVLNAASVTGNLMRLNMAFCMAAGDTKRASERFAMEQVLAGNIPESILNVKV